MGDCRARVLSAARRAYEAHGPGVPLARIAYAAGVGPATVQRHFPTGDALREAVLSQYIEGVTSQALREPGTDPFFSLLTSIVESAPVRQALCRRLVNGEGWPRKVLDAAGRRLDDVLTARLRTAQAQGRVRSDVGMPEVRAVLTAAVAARHAHPEVARATGVVLDSLRPPGPVTKPPADAEPGHETPPGHEWRHETRCEVCGNPLRRRGTGRPARYCGATCRQRAHRDRRRAAPEG
ncbi:TetR family transcriptional regulator [Stackebrandtia albiflava]|uniref:TetR family transcriptional regulator n=2 Tax=Stackebrandtia albiflava TaxID=406432 RepID=A0A562VE69_9ACTN|nr:TetR family transcriptional regulator [Stackebrandtia albiflava]